MSADRDHFGGCHNVPMFADDTVSAPAPVADGPTLADYVKSIDARRVVHQLELPAELMPRADGQLFS